MVLLFSFLLLLGALTAQCLDLSAWHSILEFIASVCLAFIMIEVGIEFSYEQKPLKSYGWDLAAATAAAVLPAVFCAAYFIITGTAQSKAALLMGISAAPTSAGVLFTMLSAAGLGATWVYQKARVLAILDDLVTILLLAPLELLVHGFQWTTLETLVMVAGCIVISFRLRNSIALPMKKSALLLYAVLLNIAVSLFEQKTNIHLEVLIPAFMVGCLLRHDPNPVHAHEKETMLGNLIKGLFMLLVGAVFPKIKMANIDIVSLSIQVLLLMFLANLGKSFLVLCYRREASLKERCALAVAMFPRGEVGAAVLLIALGYGYSGIAYTLAFFSLMGNLLMTGFFIWLVAFLTRKR